MLSPAAASYQPQHLRYFKNPKWNKQHSNTIDMQASIFGE
jgi:hypothetical protein